MFKQTNLIKCSRGFTLVEGIVTVGLLAGAAYMIMNLSEQSSKTLSNNEDRNQALLISEYIVSQIAYAESCLASTTLSNSEILTILNNKQGNYTLLTPDSSAIVSGEFNNFFKTKIEKFSIEKIELSKVSNGYKFYSGELNLEVNQNDKITKNKLGSINFLVNDMNFVIACARKTDLQLNSEFIAAKKI